MSDRQLEEMCAVGKSLYTRGYAHGSTGNLSVRIDGRIFITATGGSLEHLRPEALAEVDPTGRSHNTNRPSKEAPLHLGLYRQRPRAHAIVHLHSPWSVALSCLENMDPESPVPALTPYFFMRVAPLGIVPYHRPGGPLLGEAVEAAAPKHACMLLRNHGLLCSGATLSEALDRAEELEATARLHFMLRGERARTLTPADIEELAVHFGKK